MIKMTLIKMTKLLLLSAALLLSSTLLLAQDSNSTMPRENAKDSKGQITVQGCVGRSSGDYVLTKHNPGMTYELHATGKIKLRNYLGQRVEVVGTESPSLSTSSDALNKTGSAASSTISVSAITTIDKDCTVR
jgi:hypothetical protein